MSALKVDRKHAGGSWPFPDASKDRETWWEISEDVQDQLLNAVPPIYCRGGFFVGEPADHDERGVAMHTAVVQVQGRWYANEHAIDAPTHEAALVGLRRALEDEARSQPV